MKTLERVIYRLAKANGYPHIKLSASQYMKILQQAHDRVYKG